MDAAQDSCPVIAEPIGRQVSRMLFALTGRLRTHLEEVAAAVDLTPTQVRTLLQLMEPRSMGDIAADLQCDASNVTGIVDRLEERRLVERRSDRVDRRRTLLVLTDAGEEVRRGVLERIVGDHPLLRRLSTRQVEELRDLLATALGDDEG